MDQRPVHASLVHRGDRLLGGVRLLAMLRGRRSFFPEMDLGIDDQHPTYPLPIRRYSAAAAYAGYPNPPISSAAVPESAVMVHRSQAHRRRGAMSAVENPEAELTRRNGAICAGLPGSWCRPTPSTAFRVPMTRQSSRTSSVRSAATGRRSATALAMLREIAGGDFAGLDEVEAEAAAMTLLGREDPVTDGARARRAAMLLPR